MEKLANGSDRIDRIGLKIAAVDPVVDHSVFANAGAKTGTKRSPRRLRSIATSQRAGRSPPARNHSIDGARKQGERRLRIRATGQLIATFGHAGEAQAKLGATLVAQKVQWSLVRPSSNRAPTESGMRNSCRPCENSPSFG
jgi:hypothetical protein